MFRSNSKLVEAVHGVYHGTQIVEHLELWLVVLLGMLVAVLYDPNYYQYKIVIFCAGHICSPYPSLLFIPSFYDAEWMVFA